MITFYNQDKIVDVCVAGETDEFTDVNYEKFNISLCQQEVVIMIFYVLLVVLSSCYIGWNKKISEASKTGYFIVIGVLTLIGVLLNP